MKAKNVFTALFFVALTFLVFGGSWHLANGSPTSSQVIFVVQADNLPYTYYENECYAENYSEFETQMIEVETGLVVVDDTKMDKGLHLYLPLCENGKFVYAEETVEVAETELSRLLFKALSDSTFVAASWLPVHTEVRAASDIRFIDQTSFLTFSSISSEASIKGFSKENTSSDSLVAFSGTDSSPVMGNTLRLPFTKGFENLSSVSKELSYGFSTIFILIILIGLARFHEGKRSELHGFVRRVKHRLGVKKDTSYKPYRFKGRKRGEEILLDKIVRDGIPKYPKVEF